MRFVKNFISKQQYPITSSDVKGDFHDSAFHVYHGKVPYAYGQLCVTALHTISMVEGFAVKASNFHVDAKSLAKGSCCLDAAHTSWAPGIDDRIWIPRYGQNVRFGSWCTD